MWRGSLVVEESSVLGLSGQQCYLPVPPKLQRYGFGACAAASSGRQDAGELPKCTVSSPYPTLICMIIF